MVNGMPLMAIMQSLESNASIREDIPQQAWRTSHRASHQGGLPTREDIPQGIPYCTHVKLVHAGSQKGGQQSPANGALKTADKGATHSR